MLCLSCARPSPTEPGRSRRDFVFVFGVADLGIVTIGGPSLAQLSERLGYCQTAARQRVLALLEALRLPVTYTGISPQRLLEAMAHDKKAVDGTARFILLQDIGTVVFNQEVPLDTLHALLVQPT